MAPFAGDALRAVPRARAVRRRASSRMTTPPPTPVPMMTPNATRAPRAAPHTASASAKQFASFAKATSGVPSACARSARKGMSVEAGRVRVLDERHGATRFRPRAASSRSPGMPTPMPIAGARRRVEACVARDVRDERARLLDDVRVAEVARGRDAAPREHLGIGAARGGRRRPRSWCRRDRRRCGAR